MNLSITTAVVALKTLTLVLGGSISFYAFQSYRRTESTALRALVLGFGTVTLGAILAGIADQLLPVDPISISSSKVSSPLSGRHYHLLIVRRMT